MVQIETVQMIRNKYKILLIILVMALGNNAIAQDKIRKWGIGLSTGFASFSMKDLKEYQAESHGNFTPEGKIVKSFPAYWMGSFHVSYIDSIKFFDLSVGRTSTGGRLSYSDYSGEYSHDLTVVMVYSAASAGFRVGRIKKWNIFASAQVLAYSNLLKQRYREEIYDVYSDDYTIQYTSINLALAPGFELHRHFGSHLVLRQQTSYEIHIPGKLFLKDDFDYELTNEAGDNVKVQAQGFRIKIGLVYLF